MKRLTLITLVVLITACVTHHILAQGVVYVSNLGHAWTQAGIGDIHALFPGGTPNGTDTAYFTTGSGDFLLNAITLEFEDDSSYPAGTAAPQWISLQLFQQAGGNNVFLGTFGNPVTDPTPTPWPESSNPNAYTTYYDFSSTQPIYLNPLSQYSVVVSMPADSPVSAALLFTLSSSTSPAGWTMQPSDGEYVTGGEYLVMGIEATSVPEPKAVVILISGIIVLCGWYRYFQHYKNEHSS